MISRFKSSMTSLMLGGGVLNTRVTNTKCQELFILQKNRDTHQVTDPPFDPFFHHPPNPCLSAFEVFSVIPQSNEI